MHLDGRLIACCKFPRPATSLVVQDFPAVSCLHPCAEALLVLTPAISCFVGYTHKRGEYTYKALINQGNSACSEHITLLPIFPR